MDDSFYHEMDTPEWRYLRINAMIAGQRRIEQILSAVHRTDLFASALDKLYTSVTQAVEVEAVPKSDTRGRATPGYTALIFQEWKSLYREIRDLREEQRTVPPHVKMIDKAFAKSRETIQLTFKRHFGWRSSRLDLKPSFKFGQSYCIGNKDSGHWRATIKTRPAWHGTVHDKGLTWPTQQKFVADLDPCPFDELMAERILGDLPEFIFMAKAKYLDMSHLTDGTQLGYLSWIEQADDNGTRTTVAMGLKATPEKSLRQLGSAARSILYKRIG